MITQSREFPSGWSFAVALSWLLVLTVLSVLTARFGPWLTRAAFAAQVLLVAFVFMRAAGDRRVHWLIGFLAVVLLGVRAGLLQLDRAECQPEVDRFESTPLDPSHAGLPADD
jgi:hypothetical protein